MKVFYFTGTNTTLHLSPEKFVRLTKRGQRVELTDEEAERHASEAPLVPEAEWNPATKSVQVPETAVVGTTDTKEE